jgi:hypothetical protein
MNFSTPSITIRRAYADDESSVRQLAALDSAPVPPMPLLIAEVDGEPRAALSLCDGAAVADPFFPTVHLLELLALHAATTRTAGRRKSPWSVALRRLVPRLG